MMNGPIDMSGERVNMPATDGLQVIPEGPSMTEAERIARALQTIKLQLGTGQWSLHEIRHILEGKQP